MFLYLFFRVLIRFTLRVFYKEFFVLGREKLPQDGPLIMVANHPNTLMDPLIVASLLKQRAGFLGNGSLFRNKWMAALLSYFHVIPIWRKQDILPGEVMDNQDSFRDTRAYLAKGGTILIFPEGTSFSEKKLRELRTGAARIALSFEEEQKFKGNLRLVPVSLNYSDPTKFRSRIRIEVGEPIAVSGFQADFEQDPAEAVRALTDAIREGIAERLVIVEDKEQEVILNQISRLYLPRVAGKKPTTKGKTALEVELAISKSIRKVREGSPTTFQKLQRKLSAWFQQIDQLGLSDAFFRKNFSKWPIVGLWLLQLFLLVVTFPLYLFGILTSYFAYWLPGWLAPKISHEIEYHAPIMMVTGMFLFPIWYGLLILAFWLLSPFGGWALLGFGLLLPLAGAFAMLYAAIFRHWRAVGKLLGLSRKDAALMARLRAQRDSLIAELEMVRKTGVV